MGRIKSKQDKFDALLKTSQHLNITIGEFSKICGSSYIGSLREFKDLVKVKLLLDSIQHKMLKGITMETRQIKDKALIKESLNKILLANLGRPTLVESWWESKNLAFNLETPASVFKKNPDAVVRYLMQHANGDYS